MLKYPVLVVAMLFAIDVARAQKPSWSDATSNSERAAYSKALCVYEAIADVSRVFTPHAGQHRPMTPEVKAQAKRELDAFFVSATNAVKRCLSEQDVYNLGRYSWLEDAAFANGSGCKLRKAPAAKFGRTPDNSDGDLVNGAVHWVEVKEPLTAHPFFSGQSDAREEFKNARDGICRAIVGEYGPEGSRLPGLVRLP